jgi:putative nucleotidyltransferase with HDIG domain
LFGQIIEELRSMARDGFVEGAHVEGLAQVPSASLDEVRAVVSKLPVFPVAALKAMQLAQNPLASAMQLEQIVGSDPVLAGEVLRMANSPLYAPPVPYRSIRQAVVAMGIPECCRILSAAAFRPLFQSPLVRPLWSHSMEVARMAESLARETGKVEREEAFLTGLMHDIGRLALWKLPSRLTAQYTALLDHGCEPMFAETLLCGFDHCSAGGEVMRHWRLPERLAEAVEYHHQPERSDSMLAQVLYLAEHCSGTQEDLPSLARVHHAQERLGLTSEELSAMSSTQPLC